MFLDILGSELFLNGVIDHKTDAGIIQDSINRGHGTGKPAYAEGCVLGDLTLHSVCAAYHFVILRQIF